MQIFCIESTFILQIFCRLPYKSNPPVGYVIVWFIQFMTNFYLVLCFAALLCHTISECWLIIEFIKDILSDWSDAVSEQSDHELKAYFGKTIQLHSNVKELSEKSFVLGFLKLSFIIFLFIPLVFRLINEFNATSEYLILVLFSYIMLNICSSLLVFMSQIVEYITSLIKLNFL